MVFSLFSTLWSALPQSLPHRLAMCAPGGPDPGSLGAWAQWEKETTRHETNGAGVEGETDFILSPARDFSSREWHVMVAKGVVGKHATLPSSLERG